MKKQIAGVLAFIMIFLLATGCKDGSQETAVLAEKILETQIPQRELTDLEKVLCQENLVDDSYSFIRPDPQNDGYANMREYMPAEVYPEYLDRWVENGQVIDNYMGISGNTEKGYHVVGWVLFRGKAKPETGWQPIDGKDLYCRAFWGRHTADHTFTINASQAGIPLPAINARTLYNSRSLMYGLNNEPYPFPGLDITKAELFVHSLGRSFTLVDTQKLERLSQAIGPNLDSEGPEFHITEGWDPIVITMADGKEYLVNIMSDGFPFVDAWEIGLADINFYELFGVPSDSKGYTTDEQGNTVQNAGGKITVTAPDGRILSITENKEKEDGRTHCILRTYTYRDDLQPDRITVMDDGEVTFVTEYFYDERGLLVKETQSFMGEQGAYYTYEYDEQGRRTAKIWHNPDGSTGRKSSNEYYWYDETGVCHTYQMGDDGTVVSGDAPAGPVRR